MSQYNNAYLIILQVYHYAWSLAQMVHCQHSQNMNGHTDKLLSKGHHSLQDLCDILLGNTTKREWCFCLVTLRIHDPFSQKTPWNVTFMPFLWCHFISNQDRPNKVYISLKLRTSCIHFKNGNKEMLSIFWHLSFVECCGLQLRFF